MEGREKLVMEGREKLEARLRELRAEQLSPVEGTRKFLRTYCSDADSMGEIREDVARTIAVNPRSVVVARASIEALLSDPPRDGSIAYMVAVDGNRALDDPSDEGAIAWLQRIACLLREVLGEPQPPR